MLVRRRWHLTLYFIFPKLNLLSVSWGFMHNVRYCSYDQFYFNLKSSSNQAKCKVTSSPILLSPLPCYYLITLITAMNGTYVTTGGADRFIGPELYVQNIFHLHSYALEVGRTESTCLAFLDALKIHCYFCASLLKIILMSYDST